MTLFGVRLKAEDIIFMHRAHKFIAVFAKAERRVIIANYVIRVHEIQIFAGRQILIYRRLLGKIYRIPPGVRHL